MVASEEGGQVEQRGAFDSRFPITSPKSTSRFISRNPFSGNVNDLCWFLMWCGYVSSYLSRTINTGSNRPRYMKEKSARRTPGILMFLPNRPRSTSTKS